MPREQLRKIWQSASWEKVIEVFGLEVDEKRRSKADEIWIKSPFTGEKTASLHLNLSENIFKDFSSGLGAKVGVLNFCQELLGRRGQAMNCYEVASWMMENGISDIDDLDISSQEVKRNVQVLKEPEENKPIRVDLRRWLQPQHPELRRRQVSEATCRYLGCGFLPERPKGTAQSPLNGRLVFQVRGVSGLKPVILTHVGRALTPQQEKTDGKYWSFPFFKRLEIYNQDKLLLDVSARQQVERFGLVLVEGFFDVAALVESGCLNVGALMGSHMTEKQMALIKFISSRVPIPKITVFLDRDEAGITGAEKAVALLRSNGFSVEAFDWNQTFEPSGFSLDKIPTTVMDAGDMSLRQLQWLRKQGRI
jgi:DNA primase